MRNNSFCPLFSNMDNISYKHNKYAPVKFAYNIFKPAIGTDNNLAPLIFLHALTDVKESWRNIPQIIADGTMRQAYTYDARNHGDTEYSDIFSFDLNVDDLFHFMDTLNIEKAILIGHSMGGITAIKAALKKPDRIEMVFIEDMHVRKCPKEVIEHVNAFYQIRMDAILCMPKEITQKTEAVKYVADFIVDCIFKKLQKNIFDKEELIDFLDTTIIRNTDGVWDYKFNKEFFHDYLKTYENEMIEPIGQFDGPAYFLYGSLSVFQVGKEEEHIKKHFPKAELIEFEGIYHKINFQEHEKYIEIILQRLTQ